LTIGPCFSVDDYNTGKMVPQVLVSKEFSACAYGRILYWLIV